MAANRIEHVVADMATVLAGGVPISIYNTLAPDQVGYVAEHADPRIVVLETDDHVARWALGLKREEVVRVVTIDTAWRTILARSHGTTSWPRARRHWPRSARSWTHAAPR